MMSAQQQPTPITIPLLNPNEPEALLARLEVLPGQHVEAGALIAVLETTKDTAELLAETAGYLTGLRFQAGDSLPAGEVLGYLSPTPEAAAPATAAAVGEGADNSTAASTAAQPQTAALAPERRDEAPAGLRLTQPARALASELGLDLARLPSGPLITEGWLREWLAGQSGVGGPHPPAQREPAVAGQPAHPAHGVEDHSAGTGSAESAEDGSAEDGSAEDGGAEYSGADIVIYGAGGHAKMLIDLLRGLNTYRIAGIIDDGRPSGSLLGYPVLGGGDVLPKLYARGLRLAVNAVGGVSNVQVRVRIFERLAAAGFACPPLVHRAAVIEPSAQLSAGAQIFALAYVGSEARVGYGSIVNTGAIVSHDCRLGEYTNLSPGAILAGEVTVGRGALVGMGATVNLRVQIGAGARVGNGATVKRDVPETGIVRAGTIWPLLT